MSAAGQLAVRNVEQEITFLSLRVEWPPIAINLLKDLDSKTKLLKLCMFKVD